MRVGVGTTHYRALVLNKVVNLRMSRLANAYLKDLYILAKVFEVDQKEDR